MQAQLVADGEHGFDHVRSIAQAERQPPAPWQRLAPTALRQEHRKRSSAGAQIESALHGTGQRLCRQFFQRECAVAQRPPQHGHAHP